MNKELVWFNPGLIMTSVNNTSDCQWARAMYNLTKKNVCLVDSTGLNSKYGNGLNFKYVADNQLGFNLNSNNIKNGEYWYNNFQELARKISNSIFDRAQDYDELRISYSGGTDSLFTLAALLDNPRSKKWVDQNKFIIYTTPYAKIEDVAVWQRLIQMNLPMMYADYEALNFDKSNYFMVTGEGENYGTWWQMMTAEFSNDQIFKLPYNAIIKQLEQWCLNREPSGLAWDYIRELIKLSNIEIKNLHQAWNWVERSLATQCFVFRPTIYGSGEVYTTPNKNWSWFPADIDFWDMCDYAVSSEKVIFNDSLIKYQCLKFIANWMGWSDVRPKKKFNSQIVIPKFIRKNRIFSDMTWDTNTEAI